MLSFPFTLKSALFAPKRLALLALFALALTACGSVATEAPTLPPTEVLPTRVAVLPTAAANGGGAPGASPAAVSALATAVPTLQLPTVSPTITLIPRTPTSAPATRVLATATKVTTPVPGDPKAGQTLFVNGTGNTSIPACSLCHALDASQDVGKIGPLMQGIASRAGSRVPGQDAYTYIRTSIIDPSAYIVPNASGKVFSADGKTSLMYANYAKDLTQAQIDDLVAFLLTQK